MGAVTEKYRPSSGTELVDPNADTLEAHPKFSRIAEQRNKLLGVLKACDLSEFPYAREVIAEAEGAA